MTDDPETTAVPKTRAVAIEAEEEGRNPRITATGRGYLAERILNIAFESGVRVRQDRELTTLLSTFEVESPVPLEAIDAVAEILRYVYALERGSGPAGPSGGDASWS